MTANDFMKLSAGQISGCYLLFGEEEYTKLSCLTHLRSLMFGQTGDDPFNHHKIVCTEAGWEERLTNAVDTLPVFAEQKLVELHSLSFTALPDSQLSALLEIFEQTKQSDDTILVVYALSDELSIGKSAKKPSAQFQKLTAVLTAVSCDRQTPGRLAGWVGRHFSAEGVVASALVCQELVDKCGTDMFLLANEVKKLAYYTLSKGEKNVTAEDIEIVCCAGKDVGAFDFTNAIVNGDAPKAMQLLTDMHRRKEKPELVLSNIIDTLIGMYLVKRLTEAGKKTAEIAKETGLHEFRVKLYSQSIASKSHKRLQKALDLCAEADSKIKSTALDNYTVLEILVLRLCRV